MEINYVRKKGKVRPVYVTKAYGEVDVSLHSFLTLALDGDEYLASHPRGLTPRERAPAIIK
jgi:hypothetical protein